MTIDNLLNLEIVCTNFHFSRGFTAKPSLKMCLIAALTVGFFGLIVCVAAVAVVILKW